MLKTQVITNTWKCDGLDCPAPEEQIEDNPYCRITVCSPGSSGPACEIDLCAVCIQTITAPKVVDYVNDV